MEKDTNTDKEKMKSKTPLIWSLLGSFITHQTPILSLFYLNQFICTKPMSQKIVNYTLKHMKSKSLFFKIHSPVWNLSSLTLIKKLSPPFPCFKVHLLAPVSYFLPCSHCICLSTQTHTRDVRERERERANPQILMISSPVFLCFKIPINIPQILMISTSFTCFPLF